METVNWVVQNHVQLITVAVTLVSAAEIVTRLTPTQKDDGFVERVGKFIRKVADFLKVPNNLKK